GRGDQFELLMELDTLAEIHPDKLAPIQKSLAGLIKLQKDLKRKENATKPELSQAQLAATESALEQLAKDASDTPFHQLVSVISRDLKLQSQRDNDVAALAKRIIGNEAPGFTLDNLSGKAIESTDLSNQIVVLHFWKYHDNPLTEPYG